MKTDDVIWSGSYIMITTDHHFGFTILKVYHTRKVLKFIHIKRTVNMYVILAYQTNKNVTVCSIQYPFRLATIFHLHGSDRNTLRRVHLYHEHNILPIFLPLRTLTLFIRNCRSIKMTMQWRLQISGTPSNQMDSTRSLDRQRSLHNYQRRVSSWMFGPNFKILRFLNAPG